MREVVVHGHAFRPAHDLETTLDARKRSQTFGNPLGTETDFGGDSKSGERVAYVVMPEQRDFELRERRAMTTHLEARTCARRRDVVRLPCHVVFQAERLDPRMGLVRKRFGAGAV